MNRLDQATRSSGKVDKRAVLFVAVMAAFLTPFMSSSLNVAIPSIAKEFAVDAVASSWIATAYLLGAAMSLVPLGRMADIHGRKKIFLLGGVSHTIVSLLCGLAPSDTVLIVLRALQGIAGAMMFGTCTAILTSVFPPGERGRALGIAVASVYIGLSIGPFIGGVLTQYLGWRSIFFLTAIQGGLVVGLVIWGIQSDWVGARGQKLDVTGSVFYGLTLLAMMYGFSLLPEMVGVWLILLSLVGLLVFVLWESRVSSPVLDVGLFRHNTVFALSNLTALLNYASTYAVSFLLSLYLQYVKGFDPHVAGIILLSQPVMMAIFSPLAGRLSDRIEPRILASIGMALTSAGLTLIAFLNSASDVLSIVIASTVCGLGFGVFSSPNLNAAMSSVDPKSYGVASAATNAMRLIGQMLSMGIATLIMAVLVGKVQITPQYYPAFLDAFRSAFIVFAVLCFAGVFASLARGKLHAEAPADVPAPR